MQRRLQRLLQRGLRLWLRLRLRSPGKHRLLRRVGKADTKHLPWEDTSRHSHTQQASARRCDPSEEESLPGSHATGHCYADGVSSKKRMGRMGRMRQGYHRASVADDE